MNNTVVAVHVLVGFECAAHAPYVRKASVVHRSVDLESATGHVGCWRFRAVASRDGHIGRGDLARTHNKCRQSHISKLHCAGVPAISRRKCASHSPKGAVPVPAVPLVRMCQGPCGYLSIFGRPCCATCHGASSSAAVA